MFDNNVNNVVFREGVIKRICLALVIYHHYYIIIEAFFKLIRYSIIRLSYMNQSSNDVTNKKHIPRRNISENQLILCTISI